VAWAGISAHRLRGTLPALGGRHAVERGLRRHHPDLMAQTAKSRDKVINR
jgi:nitronate monooxygenase